MLPVDLAVLALLAFATLPWASDAWCWLVAGGHAEDE
jgi:hypothetical protein